MSTLDASTQTPLLRSLYSCVYIPYRLARYSTLGGWLGLMAPTNTTLGDVHRCHQLLCLYACAQGTAALINLQTSQLQTDAVFSGCALHIISFHDIEWVGKTLPSARLQWCALLWSASLEPPFFSILA